MPSCVRVFDATWAPKPFPCSASYRLLHSTERAKNGPHQLQVRDLVWVYDDDDALFWPGKVMARTDAGYRVQMFVNLAAYVPVCSPGLSAVPP